MSAHSTSNNLPPISDVQLFDRQSGGLVETLIFNHRLLILLVIAVASLFLGWRSLSIELNASYERMIPQSHPWIQNYLSNQDELGGFGNSIRIAVENKTGDVLDPHYLDVLSKMNDEIYLLPGVDRAWMRSLWMPLVRWTEVTEEGFVGGPVMPGGFNGSPEKVAELRRNILRANIVGNLVSNDFKTSMIVVPLLEARPGEAEKFDYNDFNNRLDDIIKRHGDATVDVHITGFARLMGDLLRGIMQVIGYFAASVIIAAVLVYLYTRCLRSTLLLVGVSLLGVVWMLGLMELCGFVLDPYSMLGPFLIFAIGLSHGAQKMNGVMQDIGRGTDRYIAARYTFRRLFAAGLVALLVNVVGFAVLIIIDIPVIRDLSLSTSLGVSVLIFTKLVLIPVLLSYVGVSPAAARRAVREERGEAVGVMGVVWNSIARFTFRPAAIAAMVAAAALAVFAMNERSRIQIGDLDDGAPELRADSRYNRDIAFMNDSFSLSNEQFAVIVRTPPNTCYAFRTLNDVNRLAERLRDVPGVMRVRDLSDSAAMTVAGAFEGNPKWIGLNRNESVSGSAVGNVKVKEADLLSNDCTVLPVVAYLEDHRADTLKRVAAVVQEFARANNTDERQYLLAAGNAGIEAAVNESVHESFWMMHFLLYGVVTLLCLITFRSWRATLVALIPLMITSILCEALMVWLGIGIKVATLPVIALGVGVGVDYALYLLSIQLTLQRNGATLYEAYKGSLGITGKVVGLIGVTMAAGVLPWAWSPIKFQADMGILLTFMFLWNMIGALLLIPALSHVLLRGKADKDVKVANSRLQVVTQR